MRILMIGDVVGRPGRHCLRDLLPKIKTNYKIDFTIANGENLASGTGFNPKTAGEVFSSGVDILTMGNHVWDKKEALSYIMHEPRIVRPVNYPTGTPGVGYAIYSAGSHKIGVINACGRVFMTPLDCPFRAIGAAIREIRSTTQIIIVDFHAEATSEKIAMGRFLDGQITAVVGTHTHVQTADERVLNGGTAYITDVGMTGPQESVLGIVPETVIRKFITQMPERFEVQTKGPIQFNAVIIDVDTVTGLAKNISRLIDYHQFE